MTDLFGELVAQELVRGDNGNKQFRKLKSIHSDIFSKNHFCFVVVNNI